VLKPSEIAPGPDVVDRENLTRYMYSKLGTAYHPVGTCRMGDTDNALTVVSPSLSPKGCENIRVIDASIMP